MNSGLSLRMFAKKLTERTELIEVEERTYWVKGRKIAYRQKLLFKAIDFGERSTNTQIFTLEGV